MIQVPGQLDIGLAAVLGALQGVAEFLPISSSGHLSVAEMLWDLDSADVGHRFNIVVHAGTLLAVCWVYRFEIARLLSAAVRRGDTSGRAMLRALALGCLPLGLAVLPGVKDLVVEAERNLVWIGCAFVTTALLLAVSRRLESGTESEGLAAPMPWHAVLIGVAQAVAIAPGISRSGATIAAGLVLGLGRAQAARFSFLLSLPAIGAAVVWESLDAAADQGAADQPWLPYLIGFLVSAAVGLASLKLLLRILDKYGLLPFVPYLVAVGVGAILLG